MTNNPYDNDPYGATGGSEPDWGPQPVTGPQNPFAGGRYADPGQQQPRQDPIYGTSYGSDPYNPFAGRHLPQRYGYNAPPPDRQRHVTMLRLNAWLSAFFPIAGLIFFFVEKGKQPLYDKHLKETFNMALTRLLIAGGASMFSGWLGAMFGIATAVYFVFAILGAIQGPTKYLEGQEMRYKGAIPFTRD